MSKPFFDPEPRVIAHRGASGEYPENTALSFCNAVEIGVDVIETDIHFTKDGSFLVIHDEDLHRVSDGTGHVADHTLAELRRYDAGYRFTTDGGTSFPFRGKGLSFMSLEEMLEEFPDQRFNIDLKSKNTAQVAPYLEIIRKMKASDRVLTASEHGPNTALVRRLMPEMATSFGLWPALAYYFLFKSGILYFKKRFPQDALQIPEFFGISRVITHSFIEQAHEKGLRVHVWTINDEGDMRRLYEMGADAVMSDHPVLLKKVAKEFFS